MTDIDQRYQDVLNFRQDNSDCNLVSRHKKHRHCETSLDLKEHRLFPLLQSWRYAPRVWGSVILIIGMIRGWSYKK